jgi:glycosyltransferase involved in cell wall biosynthesis
VVRSYNDPRIRYFRQKRNISVNDNFNHCLGRAEGEYFLLLHDDDRIDADFVSTCMHAVDNKPNVGVIITSVRVIDANGKEKKPYPNQLTSGSTFYEFVKGWLEHRMALYYCCIFYNTRYLKKLGGLHSKHNLYEDVVATVQLAAKHSQIHCKDVKASFRVHGSNRGDSAGVMNWCEDCVYLLNIISKLLPDKNEDVLSLARIFFSKQCYGFALGIPSPMMRLYTYHKIYKAFKFSHSPRRYLRGCLKITYFTQFLCC